MSIIEPPGRCSCTLAYPRFLHLHSSLRTVGGKQASAGWKHPGFLWLCLSPQCRAEPREPLGWPLAHLPRPWTSLSMCHLGSFFKMKAPQSESALNQGAVRLELQPHKAPATGQWHSMARVAVLRSFGSTSLREGTAGAALPAPSRLGGDPLCSSPSVPSSCLSSSLTWQDAHSSPVFSSLSGKVPVEHGQAAHPTCPGCGPSLELHSQR